MNVSRRHVVKAAAMSSIASTALPSIGWAQAAYPNRPVSLIIPFAPGGTTDIVARALADRMLPSLGQPMVAINKAGGGGVIGAMEVKRAAIDGYTIGMATVSTTATVPAITPQTPYDPIKDFTPIINLAATPNVIIVSPSFPAKDYKSFIEYLRRNPGKLNYGSSGTGGNQHLYMELFKALTGTFVTHIPYRSAGGAMVDLLGGNISIMFDNMPSAMPHIQAGRVVPIAVASPQRLQQLPNVPTFQELGLNQVNRMAFYGFWGPPNLPQPIVDRLHSACVKTLADPLVKRRIEESGSVIIGNSPAEFAKQIIEEFDVFKKIVKEKNLRLDS
jgi:tripartite-type tricarboxylate transporter receptor subunit TctC